MASKEDRQAARDAERIAVRNATPCPRCGAAAGERCFTNAYERERGADERRDPNHQERTRLYHDALPEPVRIDEAELARQLEAIRSAPVEPREASYRRNLPGWVVTRITTGARWDELLDDEDVINKVLISTAMSAMFATWSFDEWAGCILQGVDSGLAVQVFLANGSDRERVDSALLVAWAKASSYRTRTARYAHLVGTAVLNALDTGAIQVGQPALVLLRLLATEMVHNKTSWFGDKWEPETWPWPRAVIAQALVQLREQGFVVPGVDPEWPGLHRGTGRGFRVSVPREWLPERPIDVPF